MVLIVNPYFLTLAAWLFNGAKGFDVRIPVEAPPNSHSIPADFASLSIELDGWLEWVGKTSRNDFFYNALENIVQISGVPPRIRVGGKTQDRAYWSGSTEIADVIYPVANSSIPYPEALRVNVGDGFYRACNFLPNNTRVTHGLNFASADSLRGVYHLNSILNAYLSPSFLEAKIRLEAVEIGHEPDLYLENRYPQPYTASKYVSEWSTWAGNVLDYIPQFHPDIVEYGLKFWAGSLSASSHSSTGFSPESLFKEGLLTKTSAGPAISSFSQHHYNGNICAGSDQDLQDVLAKHYIRSNLSVFAPDIAITRAQGLEYVLGEIGTFTTRASGVSDVAGSAIWALDYLLHASHLGVSRVFFHQGIGYRSNIAQPVALPRSPSDGKQLDTPLLPYIQPQYYATIIAAEAIGPGVNTRISELVVDHPALSAYAFYSEKSLTRVLFINSRVYLRKNGRRKSIRVDLDFMGRRPRRATVKRLSIASADDTSNLRWGGVTYETESGRPAGTEESIPVRLERSFEIRDTEVALISFV
ncbi:hypothetical protein FA15DRAFT_588192 [Coprinopsis marcescibilis]|uniref:Beta-glucuronidase C-terminal domain-containing protein n=1 Tax=Coprinopsis marcescibilis TaxID=230819 RepID=A0A5C3L1M7_COPMA|nr:hypothetical protein FA15DRAFT_588192 [Coprinopsis marcescibilis]